MATYDPIYRFTVYAPRSEDSGETTVLTPPAGAIHSDEFKVASKTGVSGFHVDRFAQKVWMACWT